MAFEVNMSEWDCHVPDGYPEDVTITGLGPCVGVIVYDSESKVSFSTHLTYPDSSDAAVLDEMLSEAAARFSNSAQVRVYVTGACDENRTPSKETLAKRGLVAAKVSRAFPNATQFIEWPGAGVTSTSIALVPETGEHQFGGP